MNVLILGGGISGLSAAWYLHKRCPRAKITLLEAKGRLGGWIETKEENGFVFELGPRTFPFARAPKLLALIRDVGLGEEIVSSSNEAAHRFLYFHGKLRSLSSLWPHLILPVVKELFVPRFRGEEETIYAFAKRRFSPFVADYLFDPLTLGIFGGDAKTLSLSSCLPSLHRAELEKGSVIRALFPLKKAPKGLFTLKRGMGSLIEALQNKIPMQVHLNCPVERVTEEGVFAGGHLWKADSILSALPLFEVQRLFHGEAKFVFASLTVVNLVLPETASVPSGYGYLIPSVEKEELLGMVWDYRIFPHLKGKVVTAMIRPEAENPLKVAEKALRSHLKIVESPLYFHVMRSCNSIPQFTLGYRQRLEDLFTKVGVKVLLSGAYIKSPAVEGCLQSAEEAVQKICT